MKAKNKTIIVAKLQKLIYFQIFKQRVPLITGSNSVEEKLEIALNIK